MDSYIMNYEQDNVIFKNKPWRDEGRTLNQDAYKHTHTYTCLHSQTMPLVTELRCLIHSWFTKVLLLLVVIKEKTFLMDGWEFRICCVLNPPNLPLFAPPPQHLGTRCARGWHHLRSALGVTSSSNATVFTKVQNKSPLPTLMPLPLMTFYTHIFLHVPRGVLQ